MIDLHMHILPGMDDGARSPEEAFEMAMMAADSGVVGAAAVIHANLPDCKDQDVNVYLRALRQLQNYLAQEKIPLRLYSGMEIFAQGDFIDRLKAGELLTLNHSRYVLVEVPMNMQAAFIYKILWQLLENGYCPVLAHPERYACVQAMPAHVYEWRTMGVVIQVNKGSILGRFGERVRQTAQSLLVHDLVSVVASDAHGADRRTPEMADVSQILAGHLGEKKAWRLLMDNPQRILANKDVHPGRPEAYNR